MIRLVERLGIFWLFGASTLEPELVTDVAIEFLNFLAAFTAGTLLRTTKPSLVFR